MLHILFVVYSLPIEHVYNLLVAWTESSICKYTLYLGELSKVNKCSATKNVWGRMMSMNITCYQ